MADKRTIKTCLKEQSARLERQHLQETNELLEALERHFGPEVVDVVGRVVAERTRRGWADIAHREGRNSLEDLLRIVWSSETRERGYELTIEPQDNGVMVLVRRCPVAEMARQLGMQKWANHLICKGDPFMVEGFNPRFGFQHLKSLMEGDECCQQFYFIKE
jgi:predicted ArsR family transcriptional regulator